MNQIAINSPNHLPLMKDETKMQLLKDVFFKGATPEEFQLFAHACERSGLDPFMKQIYPVKRYDSTLKREAMTIQTGIDGYRLIAERTGKYAPGKEPAFEYKDGKLFKATAYVKKLTADGTWHEIPAFAFYEEYCQSTRDGNPTHMWKKMPHSQLAKCAEALALRKAFPAELSGLYTKEEMEQSEVINVKPISNQNKNEENQEEGCIEYMAITSPESEPLAVSQLITKNEAIELEAMLSECDDNFISNVKNYLKNLNINSFHQVPRATYTAIRKRIVNKMATLESEVAHV